MIITRLKQWFESPVVAGDEEKTRHARILYTTTIIAFFYLIFVIPLMAFSGTIRLGVIFINMVIFFVNLQLQFLLRRGRITFVRNTMLVLIFIWVTMVNVSQGTIRAPATATYLFFIVIAGVFFEWRGIVMSVSATSLAIGALILAENSGFLPPPDYRTNYVQWVTYTALFAVTGGLSFYINQTTRHSLQRAQKEIDERERAESERSQAALLQETVYRIAEASQSVERLQDFYPLIHQHISGVMDARNFYIALYDEVSGLLHFVYRVDEKDPLPREPLAPTSEFTGRVFQTGKSKLLRRSLDENPFEPLLVRVPALIWVGAPLMLSGKIIGVMAVQNYDDENAYGERELRILEFVSLQVAATIARKQAQENMRLVEKRNRALIENAPDGILLLDTDRRISFASPSAFRLFGYAPGELTGRRALDLVHPEDTSAIHQRYLGLLASPVQSSFVAEFRSLHCDGVYRWVEAFFTNLLDEPGVSAVVVNFRDITERKISSEQLRKSQAELEALNRDLEKRVEERAAEAREREAIYRALFENSNDGIFLILPNGENAQVNQHGLSMLGYTLPEYTQSVHRQTFLDHSPQQKQESEARFAAVLRGEQVALYEKTLTTKDGRVIDVEINTSPVRDAGGQVILVQSVVRDITERKKAEDALRRGRDELLAANQALEQAGRLKDAFLASVSHELRTPLTGILGLAEALQFQNFGPLNDRQLKSLKNIENSGRHLLDLINDILDLSKIEANQMQLQFETCSVSTICQAVMEMTKEQAERKKQTVSFSTAVPAGTVRADPRRFKQMLVNLLSNAIKFTPEGGSLGIEVASEPDHLIQITVWDKGIGIEAKDVERLFTPFVQIDGTLARKHGGTGLGLSLVSRLVRLHGGQVSVESVPGRGSRFTLTLPRVDLS